MKSLIYSLSVLLVSFLLGGNSYAQQPQESVYGDAVKADVKMNYVYSFEEAMKLAKEQNKLIFFNCFVDWALPCHGMNKSVFSNEEFCDYMNKTFINLFVDMNSSAGQVLAKKYDVRTFAHYLILDADGNILLRIVGGKKLPEFKDVVNLALSPKTSLVGSRKIYESEKHTKENLYNYMHALEIADDDSLLNIVSKEYMAQLKPEEYADPKNWTVFCRELKDCHQDMYKYMIANKPVFVKNIGERYVNNIIESLFCPDLMKFAGGSLNYNKERLNEINNELTKASLPDTCVCRVLYNMAILRGEKKYQDLIHYLDENGKYLTVYRTNMELSLKLPEMTPQDKALLIDYLNRAAEREEGSSNARYLKSFAKQIVEDYGIKFEETSFNDALKLAKEQKKLVFMDCYTYWCGPCRMMASSVFTRKDVGDVFNKHFVNIKIDMEKGEGIELAKRYKVTAYPTMMILDTDGNIVYKFVGARSPEQLLEIAAENLDPSKGYTVMKAAYDKGMRTPEVVYNYVRVIKASGELPGEKADEIIKAYLEKISDTEFIAKECWPMIDESVNNMSDKAFYRIVNLYDKLVASNGDSVVYRKVEKVVFPYVLRYLHNEISREALQPAFDYVKKIDCPEMSTLNLLCQIIALYDENKTAEILKLYREKVTALALPLDRANLDAILPYFVENTDDKYKEEALQYVRDIAGKCQPRVKKTYAKLLAKLSGK